MDNKFVLSLIVALFAAFFFMDSRHAHSERMVAVESTLEDLRKKALMETIYDCETKYKNADIEIIKKTCKEARIEWETKYGKKE